MNNDLISREALKKAIEEYKYCGFYDKLIEIIDNAPTVDTTEQEENAYNEGYAHGLETKRPQEEWLKYGDHAWKCSKCNCSVYVRTRNFCPDCGAKMKGGAE